MAGTRRIILLGATGSIGTSTVDVVRTHRDAFRLVAVTALRNREACEAIAREFGARAYVGEDAALRAVEENEADVCLVATVGLSGLKPTLAAIEKGMDIALATKEVMVMAGELVTRRAAEKGVRFLPVDSEHSAIFQCLGGVCGEGSFSSQSRRAEKTESTGLEKDLQDFQSCKSCQNPVDPVFSSRPRISRLILTASGGPFLDGPEDLSAVTVAQALNHPRWKMGPKVTIDSATMMNKGFEILEARWLFDVPVERIDVVVHPESIVHSLVTFADGATLAQLSPPDMRVAIQYALSAPARLKADRSALDLAVIGALTFRRPDPSRFPCLDLVKEAARRGGCATAVLAAADEWAVAAFLDGRIGFTDIPRLVGETLDAAPHLPCDSLDAVFEAARWTNRLLAKEDGINGMGMGFTGFRPSPCQSSCQSCLKSC